MARTYRRLRARHEYSWVLRGNSHDWRFPEPPRPALDRHDPVARKRLARFHSDACATMKQVPSRFRRACTAHQRFLENQALRNWVPSLEWNWW